MKLVRFQEAGQVSYGVLEEEVVKQLAEAPFGSFKFTGKQSPQNSVKLLSPVLPSKVIAVGLNYIDHAKELKMAIPENPILFMKPPTSVIGPNEAIVYPAMSQQVDYEAELVIVIGRLVCKVKTDEAANYILGYCCGNDVTARDLQKKDGQWTRAKGFDTFSPLGPWVETKLDPANLKVELLLNGEVRQSSDTSKMIFDAYHLVSFTSEVMTLLPGDVIMTGTPPGVGPMQVGDKVEVKVEGIGSLINQVVEGS